MTLAPPAEETIQRMAESLAEPTWVVVLLGQRNPYDGDGGLRIVTAADAEAAVHAAHEMPPSILAVKYAWVHRLAEPYEPTLVPVKVPTPEWDAPRPANR